MKKILLSAVLATVSISASAVELDLDEKYLIGNFGLTSYDVSGLDSTIGFGASIGAPLEDLEVIDDTELFIEAGYLYFGESSNKSGGVDVSVSASTIYGAAKLRYEVQDEIYVYGKAGLGYIMTTAEATVFGTTVSSDDSELKLVYGGGALYEFSDEISIGGEYMFYSSDITSISGVVTYSF